MCACKTLLCQPVRWKQSKVFWDMVEEMGYPEAKRRRYIDANQYP